jgi:hypothetical protein
MTKLKVLVSCVFITSQIILLCNWIVIVKQGKTLYKYPNVHVNWFFIKIEPYNDNLEGFNGLRLI